MERFENIEEVKQSFRDACESMAKLVYTLTGPRTPFSLVGLDCKEDVLRSASCISDSSKRAIREIEDEEARSHLESKKHTIQILNEIKKEKCGWSYCHQEHIRRAIAFIEEGMEDEDDG